MSKRCSAKNRNGKRCGAWAMTGATKCALHADPERAAELGSKHSSRGTFQSRPDMLDLPARPLKSIDEVCELLEEMINLVTTALESLQTLLRAKGLNKRFHR